MTGKRRKPTILILDHMPDRCLREEAALDKAIEDKKLYALGAANFGMGFISRSGIAKEQLPCIELDGDFYFPPHPGEELTYDELCTFLDMLVQKGVVQVEESTGQ